MSSDPHPSHWYPARNEIAQIEGQLNTLRNSVNASSGDDSRFQVLSEDLLQWLLLPGFPKYQTRRWLWLASLLRRPISVETKKLIGAAVLYFNHLTEQGNLTERELRKLRWVLSVVCESAHAELGDDSFSLVSNEDAARIETHIEGFLSRPAATTPLSSGIKSRRKLLEKFCGDYCFPSVVAKLEALIEIVNGLRSGAPIAQAALDYVAADNDVIPDKLGALGLVDDIYVIEWAYALLSGTTTQLPILDAVENRWSFLEDLIFFDGRGEMALDRYMKYLLGIGLISVLEEGQRLVLIREAGPSSLLCSICAAVAARKKTSGLASERWLTVGTPIFIGDDIDVFRAIYSKSELISGVLRHWIKVAKNGAIGIDSSALQFVRVAPEPHSKPLSRGGDIGGWLSDRHPSALTFIAHQNISASVRGTAVLLLTQRRKLDQALAEIRPFGLDLAKLVDIRYVSSKGATESYASAASVPPVYVVNDSDTALDLLLNKPTSVLSWILIVDGAQAAVPLFAAMQSTPSVKATPTCVLAEWHEREDSTKLMELGLKTTVVQFNDVEIGISPIRDRTQNDSSLRRFLERGGVQSKNRVHFHKFRHAALEILNEECHKLNKAVEHNANRSLDRLLMNVVTFIKKATMYPTSPTNTLNDELTVLALRTRDEAHSMRLFSSEAKSVFDAFDLILTEPQLSADRTSEISDILTSLENPASFAIVTKSAVIASACQSAANAYPALKQLSWVSPERLRDRAPFEHLVVATWLGRSLMREIFHGGFAGQLHYVLLPYEMALLRATTTATSQWRERLETSNNNSKFLSTLTKGDSGQSLWTSRAPVTSVSLRQTVPIDVEDDNSEVDAIEARVTEEIRRVSIETKSTERTIKARLVLFEETGAFAYLPPEGRIIALSTLTGLTSGDSHNAEALLFRKTESLKPGMIVAFATSTSRDLVDAWADSLLGQPGRTRKRAATWKDAVRRFVSKPGNSVEDFAELLASFGEPREPSTIQAWIWGSDTIAPRNPTVMLPLIAKITKDQELLRALIQTLESIDEIYDARSRAAQRIIREIFSGQIDLDADSIEFESHGERITYELHRIKSVEPTAVMVGLENIGRVLRYQDLDPES